MGEFRTPKGTPLSQRIGVSFTMYGGYPHLYLHVDILVYGALVNLKRLYIIDRNAKLELFSYIPTLFSVLAPSYYF